MKGREAEGSKPGGWASQGHRVGRIRFTNPGKLKEKPASNLNWGTNTSYADCARTIDNEKYSNRKGPAGMNLNRSIPKTSPNDVSVEIGSSKYARLNDFLEWGLALPNSAHCSLRSLLLACTSQH